MVRLLAQGGPKVLEGRPASRQVDDQVAAGQDVHPELPGVAVLFVRDWPVALDDKLPVVNLGDGLDVGRRQDDPAVERHREPGGQVAGGKEALTGPGHPGLPHRDVPSVEGVGQQGLVAERVGGGRPVVKVGAVGVGEPELLQPVDAPAGHDVGLAGGHHQAVLEGPQQDGRQVLVDVRDLIAGKLSLLVNL